MVKTSSNIGIRGSKKPSKAKKYFAAADPAFKEDLPQKKRKKKSSQESSQTLHTDAILHLLQEGQKPLRLDQILRYMHLERGQKKHVEAILNTLAKEGRIMRMHGGQWVAQAQIKTFVGVYSVTRSGAGFVDLPTDPAHKSKKSPASIFVHPSQAAEAWHGDTVRVALLPGRTSGRSGSAKPEGRILEIVERPTKELMARVIRQERLSKAHEKNLHFTDNSKEPLFFHCVPADIRYAFSLYVDISTLPNKPERNELISVRPVHALAHNLWQAEAIAAFGREDHVHVQEQLVKLNHAAPNDFPKAALVEAENMPTTPNAEDIQGRKDVRHLPFVTIDGSTARDFDDAIYVRRLAPKGKQSQGDFCLSVGIADVTHYVHPKSALDQEARLRGNSWYFPCSVEPMLPKKLSNGLCSLNPHEDKLIMLAEIFFTPEGIPYQAEFYPAIMRSAARLTYEEVQDIYDVPHGARENLLQQKHGSVILEMLLEAKNLAELLCHIRKERGSLDFHIPEPEYIFDSNNFLINITKKQQLFSHQLIEECMIAANEAVARYLEKRGLPFLFRVHPEPEESRLHGLFRTLLSTDLAENMPHTMTKSPHAKDLQHVLRLAKGTEQEYVVGRLALRTMPQARYQPENEEHFGLASTSYCHFTSPIRRYADMVVHRALKYALGFDQVPIPTEHKLLMLGDQLNRAERTAMEAEREMARRLATLLLQGREGEIFDGHICGVSDFGIFVEFNTMPVEGMIPIRDLGDDYFEYDPERQELIGIRSGMRYSIGQPVRTKLIEADMGRLEITLGLLEKNKNRHGPKSKRPMRRR